MMARKEKQTMEFFFYLNVCMFTGMYANKIININTINEKRKSAID